MIAVLTLRWFLLPGFLCVWCGRWWSICGYQSPPEYVQYVCVRCWRGEVHIVYSKGSLSQPKHWCLLTMAQASLLISFTNLCSVFRVLTELSFQELHLRTCIFAVALRPSGNNKENARTSVIISDILLSIIQQKDYGKQSNVGKKKLTKQQNKANQWML